MSEKRISVREIMDMIPHRYPFLLVDKVLELKSNDYIKALKNVSINEPFFQGHFPDYPVMPGVLIVEALAQAGGILIVNSDYEIPKNKIFLFTSIEKLKFRNPVFPGDQLILHAKILKHKFNIWKVEAKATVDDKTAVEGILTAAMVDKEG